MLRPSKVLVPLPISSRIRSDLVVAFLRILATSFISTIKVDCPEGPAPKTMFSTHYHELTELEGKLEGVNNYCIAVTNHDQDIVFLRKIIPGGADRSYGIDVASLAGVPKPVIDRAKVIAAELSDADITAKAKNIETSESFTQEAFDEEGFLADRNEEKAAKDIENEAGYGADIREALEYLKALDVNHMTPLDAMNTLYELKSKFGV